LKLAFREEVATAYKGTTQKVRVLSEHWVSGEVYCPNCGCANITKYPNNSPVADFFCPDCKEDYELKGHKRMIASKVVDGAYRTMIERLKASNNPNLILLGYDHIKLEVRDLLVIPKHIFTPEIIEQRKPLSPTARRSGWVGCNIRLNGIPNVGRIFLVKNGVVEPTKSVISQWRRTMFLRDQKNLRSKGWLLSVMKCIDRIQRNVFSLVDLYAFEPELISTYPENKHIRPKIRQQLQVLRDMGYLTFVGPGTYQLAARTDQNGPKR
jgi:type II restriction enzyme